MWGADRINNARDRCKPVILFKTSGTKLSAMRASGVRVGRICLDPGRTQSMAGQAWPMLVEFDPTSVDFGHIRAHSAGDGRGCPTLRCVAQDFRRAGPPSVPEDDPRHRLGHDTMLGSS